MCCTNKRKLNNIDKEAVQNSLSAYEKNILNRIIDEIIYEMSPKPTIGPIIYTSSPLKIGESEKLNVTFTENTSQAERTYLIKIYCIQKGKYHLKATKKISIPSNSESVTHTFNIKFNKPGSYETNVKVYNFDGSILLAERTGKYPDKVYKQ